MSAMDKRTYEIGTLKASYALTPKEKAEIYWSTKVRLVEQLLPFFTDDSTVAIRTAFGPDAMVRIFVPQYDKSGMKVVKAGRILVEAIPLPATAPKFPADYNWGEWKNCALEQILDSVKTYFATNKTSMALRDEIIERGKSYDPEKKEVKPAGMNFNVGVLSALTGYGGITAIPASDWSAEITKIGEKPSNVVKSFHLPDSTLAIDLHPKIPASLENAINIPPSNMTQDVYGKKTFHLKDDSPDELTLVPVESVQPLASEPTAANPGALKRIAKWIFR